MFPENKICSNLLACSIIYNVEIEGCTVCDELAVLGVQPFLQTSAYELALLPVGS